MNGEWEGKEDIDELSFSLPYLLIVVLLGSRVLAASQP